MGKTYEIVKNDEVVAIAKTSTQLKNYLATCINDGYNIVRNGRVTVRVRKISQ